MPQTKLKPFGPVKTSTSRFPLAKIKEETGPNSGDWVTFVSEIPSPLSQSGYVPIWAVGHRRGDEVHAFVLSCGTSVAGHPMKHTDPVAGTTVSLGRKCPRGLNDYTAGQPIVDRANRYRQSILDIEHRWATKSYSYRHFQDYLAIIFCNAIDAHMYFNLQGNGDWTEEARSLAFKLMHNKWDREHRPRGTPAPSTPLSPEQSPAAPRSRGQPMHQLVRLKSLEGYVGKGQLKCGECGADCGWACLFCSTPQLVCAVHPETTHYRGSTCSFDCLRKHRRAPEKTKRRIPRGPSGPRKKRGNDDDRGSDSGDDDDS